MRCVPRRRKRSYAPLEIRQRPSEARCARLIEHQSISGKRSSESTQPGSGVVRATNCSRLRGSRFVAAPVGAASVRLLLLPARRLSIRLAALALYTPFCRLPAPDRMRKGHALAVPGLTRRRDRRWPARAGCGTKEGAPCPSRPFTGKRTEWRRGFPVRVPPSRGQPRATMRALAAPREGSRRREPAPRPRRLRVRREASENRGTRGPSRPTCHADMCLTPYEEPATPTELLCSETTNVFSYFFPEKGRVTELVASKIK